MVRRLIALALVILVFLPGKPQAATTATLLDEYLSACTELHRFSGSVLVATEGQILLSKGYGMANYELAVPNSPDTKFRIGSLTKQFTAMAILQLSEQGLLSLNDAVNKYLPDYPNGENITIHQLLTHTSGIADYTSNPYFLVKSMAPISLDNLIESFQDLPVEFLPGAEFSYSNSGYVLLGKIIELITGDYYDIYLTNHILSPLGLDQTGYDLGVPLLPNRAAGYIRGPNGLVNALHVDMSNLHAAGAVYSTTEDLYRWDRALYAMPLVSQETVEQIFTPQMGAYGYGWYVTDVFGRKCAMHGGGVNGFSAFMMRFLVDDTVIIVLSNIGSAPVDRISRDLAAIIFGENYLVPEV